MKKLILTLALLGMAGVAEAQTASAKPAAAPRTIVVRLIDKSATEYAFEPATYTARPGDVIRFVQDAVMPHNVLFKTGPAGVDVSKLPVSEMLVAKGQTFELKIDERFKSGTYQVICQPHESMQMTSTLTVTGSK